MEKKHILVVDDNRTILNMIEDVLIEKYKVTSLESGQEALDFLEQEAQNVDLLLTDMIMPGMSGLDVLKEMKGREKLKSIPVVFLTSNTTVETESSCLEMGAIDFIAKPFAARTLVIRIDRILELEKYQHDLEALVLEKTKKIESIQRNIVVNLANVIESRDSDLGHHVKRTGIYVEMIARFLQEEGIYKDILTEQYIATLANASVLHDIGKIAIPDSILCKPGRLTKKEFDIIMKHAEYGGRLVKECLTGVDDNHYMHMAVDIAVYHHERWDGTGYPAGLKREQIPLSARIMAVADVFDALVSKRCYKEAYPLNVAFEMIRKSRGSHFDPFIVDVFMMNQEKVEEITAGFKAAGEIPC